jgi:hypothetical protein
LRLKLIQSIFSSKIQIESNWSEGIRVGRSVKGVFVNISSVTNILTYKEIGTRSYWINNYLGIWNNISVSLGLKSKSGYTPLVRIHKNSTLVKFWRFFEIEIKQNQIELKAFFQLQFIKEILNLDKTFINMVNKVTIELLAIESHLEGVIQMFLQFDKAYLILPLETMPIYGIMIDLNEYIDMKRSQRHLGVAEREWIFEERQLWQMEEIYRETI